MSNTQEERRKAKSEDRAESTKGGVSPRNSSKAGVELDEDKIDAPSRQTLVMLSVICASTLIMWAAGRAACNYNVPGESLTPRVVSLEARTRTAKGAALEFAQAVSGADFKTAEEISQGEAQKWLNQAKSTCGACVDQKNARDQIASVATVLKANSTNASVQVRTVGGPDKEVTRFFRVDREARKWRVSKVAKTEDEVAFKEVPAPNDTPPAASLLENGDGKTPSTP